MLRTSGTSRRLRLSSRVRRSKGSLSHATTAQDAAVGEETPAQQKGLAGPPSPAPEREQRQGKEDGHGGLSAGAKNGNVRLRHFLGLGTEELSGQATVPIAVESKDFVDEKGRPEQKAGFAKTERRKRRPPRCRRGQGRPRCLASLGSTATSPLQKLGFSAPLTPSGQNTSSIASGNLPGVSTDVIPGRSLSPRPHYVRFVHSDARNSGCTLDFSDLKRVFFEII